MKKFKLLAAVILLPFIAFAQLKTGNTFTVGVKIASADKNIRLYLAYQNEGKKILDSAMEKKGFYVLSGIINRPLSATLITDNEGLSSLELIKKSKKGADIDALKFYIHPGTINIG